MASTGNLDDLDGILANRPGRYIKGGHHDLEAQVCGLDLLWYILTSFQPQEPAMARKPKLDFSNIAVARMKEGLNQKDFWKRYGVTQSGGSRYESGRNIPKPLAILLWLHRSGKVTDKDLAEASK